MDSCILIADDSAITRESIEAALTVDHYRFEMAVNGREALQKAQELHPDLILLDVLMPDMDGFEVCKRVRGLPEIAEVPVVILTALDDKESILRGFEAGADDFLRKPFNNYELRARVRTIIRLNRFRRLVEGRALISKLTERILTIQEDERRRIARELHDELGQALTTLSIGLNLLAGELEQEPQQARQRINDMQRTIQETIEQVRRMGQELRPPALDTLGLVAALEGYCHEFSHRTDLPVLFLADVKRPLLSERINITLYRFLPEALTNIARYAQASQVWVKFAADGYGYRLSVRDDGIGFPKPMHNEVTDAVERPDGSKGLGLLGIMESLELLNGSLEIESSPGQGATVSAWIPAERQVKVD